ncbi:YheC/YheD family protein [Gracilibacillus timonensis]|uniref:YheC/YheD family protein n=1 Tax=Gracilibacillus timonensis TaxID=1816696 RepID=UPI000826ACEB|nr:YheC/YheD family protein [Gracilibacillus timonensis]
MYQASLNTSLKKVLIIKQIYTITVYASQKYRMILPQKEYTTFRTTDFLQYKTKRSSCDILGHQKEAHIIYLSSALSHHLQIDDAQQVILWKEGAHCSLYHPFAIMLHQHPSRSKWLTLLQELTETGKTLGFLTVCFTLKHVDRTNKRLTAAVWEDKQWQALEIVIPPRIYNRLPNRKIEAHPFHQSIIEDLSSTAIIFNKGFFNKWNVYDQLKQQEDLAYLLPECIFHPSISTIAQQLEEKAIKLYQTNQYYSLMIEKKQDHFIAYPVLGKSKQFTNLTELISECFSNNLDAIVLQEMLSLGYPYMIRVHTIHTDKWEIVLRYGRHPDNQRTHRLETTNIPQDKLNKVDRLALQISQTLTKKKIAELAFDFAIDKEGRIWLQEVYAKPSWDIFLESEFAAHTTEYFGKLLQSQIAD